MLQAKLGQLEAIVKHLLHREYPEIRGVGADTDAPLATPEVLALLQRVSADIARLTANWIRVGFVQGR
jgi:uncharacterized protein YdiU (UPF0061 family)